MNTSETNDSASNQDLHPGESTKDYQQRLLGMIRAIPKEELAAWVAQNDLMGLFQQVQEKAVVMHRQTLKQKEEEERIKLREQAQQESRFEVVWADEALFKKACTLVCGPFNEKNKVLLEEILKKMPVNAQGIRNDKVTSLFEVSVEYIISKTRVDPDWSMFLIDRLEVTPINLRGLVLAIGHNVLRANVPIYHWLLRPTQWSVVDEELKKMDSPVSAMGFMEFGLRSLLNSSGIQLQQTGIAVMATEFLKNIKSFLDQGLRQGSLKELKTMNTPLFLGERVPSNAISDDHEYHFWERLMNVGLSTEVKNLTVDQAIIKEYANFDMKLASDSNETLRQWTLIWKDLIDWWKKSPILPYDQNKKTSPPCDMPLIDLDVRAWESYVETNNNQRYGSASLITHVPLSHYILYQGKNIKFNSPQVQMWWKAALEKEKENKPQNTERWDALGWSKFGLLCLLDGEEEKNGYSARKNEGEILRAMMQDALDDGDHPNDIQNRCPERKSPNKKFQEFYKVIKEKYEISSAIHSGGSNEIEEESNKRKPKRL